MHSARLASLLAFAALAGACKTDVQDDIFDPTTTGEGSSSSTTDPSTSSTTDASSSSTTDEGTGSSSTGSTGGDAGGQLCGDGIIDGTEQCDCAGAACDAAGLGDLACEDTTDPLNPERVLTGGDLGCNPASCQFIVEGCVWCGDGAVNGNEGCEPELAITTDCEALGRGVAGALTCDEVCQIDTTACTTCFLEETFETCPADPTSPGAGEWGALTLLGGAGAATWACGESDAHSGGPGTTTTGIWATNLTGDYNNSEISELFSPEIDLSAACMGEGATMTVRHFYNFEGSVTNADGGIVQARTDGGAWTTLVPMVAEGLFSYIPGITATHPPVSDADGFGQNSGDWGVSVFDISTYTSSSTFQVRFVFGSDGGVTDPGWYIDTITIQGMGGGA